MIQWKSQGSFRRENRNYAWISWLKKKEGEHCKGEVIIVSDADCFWPSDILEKAIPFLADPAVGAISGPKILLNSNQTWVTRMEESYLRSANVLRLGETKAGSTVFFEGGFSAFKKEAFDRFDPYATGSDDCGTVIRVIENNFRTILVPEAEFYSPFPASFQGKLSIKLRRANQLVRVFVKYLALLAEGKVKATKRTVVSNTLLYLFSPVAFVVFMFLTALLLFSFPLLLLFFAFLVIPRVRFYFYEIFESNILLLAAIFGVVGGERFSIWSQPEDRIWLTEEKLSQFNLI
jgi:cellulose synthase/poly-beta-1,6-N-acetylglucosamine synthase-like glycosyltransferase